MKFVKRLALNRYDQMSDRFAVLADDRIVTTSKKSLQFPAGDQGADRPIINVNGYARYNNDLNEFEVYNGGSPGTGWEKIRTVRMAPITVQKLGPGDYVNKVFGPLKYKSGENYKDYTHPENIFVYVENVFQLPITNYILIQNQDATVSIQFVDAVPNKYVTVYLGYDGYFPAFPTQ
jgi:hypothetical protein